MAHSTDLVGYTYQADEYCPDCIPGVVRKRDMVRLDAGVHPTTEGTLDIYAHILEVDRQDERSLRLWRLPEGDLPGLAPLAGIG